MCTLCALFLEKSPFLTIALQGTTGFQHKGFAALLDCSTVCMRVPRRTVLTVLFYCVRYCWCVLRGFWNGDIWVGCIEWWPLEVCGLSLLLLWHSFIGIFEERRWRWLSPFQRHIETKSAAQRQHGGNTLCPSSTVGALMLQLIDIFPNWKHVCEQYHCKQQVDASIDKL